MPAPRIELAICRQFQEQGSQLTLAIPSNIVPVARAAGPSPSASANVSISCSSDGRPSVRSSRARSGAESLSSWSECPSSSSGALNTVCKVKQGASGTHGHRRSFWKLEACWDQTRGRRRSATRRQIRLVKMAGRRVARPAGMMGARTGESRLVMARARPTRSEGGGMCPLLARAWWMDAV